MTQCTNPAFYPQMTYIGIKYFYNIPFDEYRITRIMNGGSGYGYKCLIDKCSQQGHLFTNAHKARKHARNSHKKNLILDSKPKEDVLGVKCKICKQNWHIVGKDGICCECKEHGRKFRIRKEKEKWKNE